MRRQAQDQRAKLLTIPGNKALTCGYIGALGGTRTPNLLIRRFQCGRPYPFRLVHDLGFVAPGCPHRFGASRGCSSVWLPAWLPRPTRAGALVVVFKSVRDLLSATAPGWTFSMSVVCVIQDHPAHIP